MKWEHEVVTEQEVGNVYFSMVAFMLLLMFPRVLRDPTGIWRELLFVSVLAVVACALTYDVLEILRFRKSGLKKRIVRSRYTYCVEISDGCLTATTKHNGHWLPFSSRRIPLTEIWGVKNTGYELRIIRTKTFDVVHSILTPQFASLDAKADFMQAMADLGKRVLSRAEDPQDFIHTYSEKATS